MADNSQRSTAGQLAPRPMGQTASPTAASPSTMPSSPWGQVTAGRVRGNQGGRNHYSMDRGPKIRTAFDRNPGLGGTPGVQAVTQAIANPTPVATPANVAAPTQQYADYNAQLDALRNGVPSAQVFAGGMAGPYIPPEGNPMLDQLAKAFPNGTSPFKTWQQQTGQA